MLNKLVTLIVVILAVIGGINVYNSDTFKNVSNNIKNNPTVQSITEGISDVTHTDSTK